MKNNKLIFTTLHLFPAILLFAVMSALLQVLPNYFTYQRDLMWPEFWRWWTAHWVHVGWMHYGLNMLALAGLPFIFPGVRIKTLVLTLIVFSPLLSLGLYVLLPQVYAYAGLSGVLHGIYVFVAIQALTEHRKERQFASLVLICIGIKVLTEKWLGYTETAELIQAPVLIESHQLGVLIGLLAGITVFFKQTLQKRFRQTL